MRDVEVYIQSFIFSALGGTEWSHLPPGKELAMCFEYEDGKAFWRQEKSYVPAGNGTPDSPDHGMS
jgi:hypothetical protein